MAKPARPTTVAIESTLTLHSSTRMHAVLLSMVECDQLASMPTTAAPTCQL